MNSLAFRIKTVRWVEYGWGSMLVVLTTLVAGGMGRRLSPQDTVMLFLLPIMLTAFRSGRGPSLTVAALAVAAYDFFFVPPYWTFRVSEEYHLLTFVIMFMVGITISTLMARIREQEQAALARERQSAALYALGRDLIAVLDSRRVAEIIAIHAVRQFGGAAWVILLDENGNPLLDDEPHAWLTPEERELVRWVCDRGRAAGRGTGYQDYGAVTCLPLATVRCLGVLVVRHEGEPGWDAGREDFLRTFADQASLALDRARLGMEARAAGLRAQSEELRGALLSMVSHDLRTPLATITGAGTALRDELELDSAQRSELVESLCVEAERMERLVSNLLEMVRLEAGGCRPHSEWVPFEELIGSALARLESRVRGREVAVTVGEEVPLLYVDPVLFEQVLLNLLDNAIKYTPPATPLVWTVAAGEGGVRVLLHDQGAGIPGGEEERIFDKFTRGRSGGVPGSGLGLAICRGIVRAHGGTIWAGNHATGGAEFRIWLPQPSQPPEIVQDHQQVESMEDGNGSHWRPGFGGGG